MADERSFKTAQQEELFGKIKSELFNSLADNFRKVESELSSIRVSKISYEDQIAEVMKTLTKTNGIGKDGKDAAQAASLKVEELLQVQ